MIKPDKSNPALWATASAGCVGREHDEADDPLRLPFELDRHRIIESMAFRRLEGKSQVFLAGHHDHFRTRLTHTLEVAQIARTLARSLGANSDLVEAIALAHDLGHPPFGHAGEAALDQAMSAHGGFNHNTHSLRVVEYLEHPYPAFRGLNLTAATRAGLAGHSTRYDRPAGPKAGDEGTSQPAASVEAQIASLADRIAYNTHDLEDAIGAGLIGTDDLAVVKLWAGSYAAMTQDRPSANIFTVRRVVLDALLDRLLADAIATTKSELELPANADPERIPSSTTVCLSDPMEKSLCELEEFLRQRVYQNEMVAEADATAKDCIQALFETYIQNPMALPQRFSSRISEHGAERVATDYLAGMTDRFCQREHARVVQA